jgi:class 3 adenylate cyclase
MVQEPPVRVERRLSAVLAADVAGYSRLMHNDEEATHCKLTALLKDAVPPAIAEHGGRIVKNTGDGFLAEFPSAVEAVRAAMQFQGRIEELTVSDVQDRRIAFRVGINIGDVIVEAHDIFGDGVNIAARLQSAAEPGGVCISGSVHDQIRNKVSLSFKFLGEQKYKNIPLPVRTYSIIGAGRPSPTSSKTWRNALNGKWLGAGFAFILSVLVGYWAYSVRQQQQTANTQDGQYVGQVCLGPDREEAARCYTANVVISRNGKISARYPARPPNKDVVIAGDASVSGEVKMELSVENSSGVRVAIAHLSGMLKNGQLNATGGFPARTVDIQMHRR